MILESGAFADGDEIPPRYSCDGADVSPPLAWCDAPPQARAFALIMDDPDAPAGTWVHWVLYDLPGDCMGLPAGAADGPLPSGASHGTNSWKRLGYGGPCPPSGVHRYRFHLFALDRGTELEPGATAEEVRRSVEGHVLAEARLTGRYGRP